MTRGTIIPRAVDPGEVVSLTARLSRLQLLRVAFVVITLVASSVAFEVSAGARDQIWIVCCAYLAAAAVAEPLHRGGRRSSLATLAIMVLLDGVVLAWLTYATGGTQSPLRFLLYVHLIAVTLLASYRTGLKIALWHSLLSLVALYAQAAELIAPREGAPGLVPTPDSGLASLPVFNVTAFWIVALVTAAFSSLNERELRRRRADSEALATMATQMEQLEHPAEIADQLLESLDTGFGFGRGVVLSARDGLSVLAHRGAVALEASTGGIDQVVQDAWESRRPVLVKRLDEDANPRLAALLPRTRRVLVLPLLSEGERLGAVALEHPGSGWRIERRLVAVTAQLVAYAGLALRNAWLVDQVRQMAHTDGLTGLANRRMFDSAAERELARSRRDGAPVSLLLIDVDHFKAFNDHHGHLAGDEVLQRLGALLLESTRPFDIAARYGGEEFALVLPQTAGLDAVEVAERLRGAVHGLPGPAPMTVSIGVATFPHDAQKVDDLIKAADDALYAAKRAGRDRTVRTSLGDGGQPMDVASSLAPRDAPARLEPPHALAPIRALARAIDARDPSTRRHSDRVAGLAGRIANVLGWSPERVTSLMEAALVHDVGKIGIPDCILLKPGRLEPEEYETMKQHVVIGAEIAAGVLSAEQVEWIRGHHERPDGGGYPDGLRDDEIPEGAAILALADAFDVMTMPRPYSASKSLDEALAECAALAGWQFTARVVSALITLFDGALASEGAPGPPPGFVATTSEQAPARRESDVPAPRTPSAAT